MRWIAALLMSLALVSGVAVAQAQEEPEEMEAPVLLTAQDADFLIASSVAENFDADLLMTDSEQLSEEVVMQMEELQPTEVVIIGGPEAISDDVVNQVEEFETVEEVNQIYGETAMETSLQVSEMFWMEAEEAAIAPPMPNEAAVMDITERQIQGPILMTADEPEEEMPENETEPEEIPEDEAVPEEEPMPEEEMNDGEAPAQEQPEENETQQEALDQELVSELERLGVQNVVLYTEDEEMAAQLEEMGITVEMEELEEIPEEEENGILDDLEEEFDDLFNGEEEPAE